MVGSTLKYSLVSGVQNVASGLAVAFNVDGTGRLRHLGLLNDGNSGTVTICVYADSGLVLNYGIATLVPNASVLDVDVVASSLQGSGAVLISGSAQLNQDVSFTNNCQVQYMKTSGAINITGIVDVNRMLIQT